MLGALFTMAFAAAVALAFRPLIERLLPESDPAEALGLAGIGGLGAVGVLLFFPGLMGLAAYSAWIAYAAVAAALFYNRARISLPNVAPTGGWQLAIAGLILLLLGIALLGAISPSTAADWDSLAYHLAVPKIWLETGSTAPVEGIHQSYFPFAVDNLYMLGLGWGGQAGAKAFSWCFLAFGGLAIFGLARRWYGDWAGWWTALIWFGSPVVLWEGSTAYIDHAHGAFVGLGVAYLAALANGGKAHWLLPAILLGLGVASKYTGLQMLGAALLAFVILTRTAPQLKRAVLVGAVALAIGSPWLIRNAVVAGNPAFPFFHSVLGGEPWDAWRAEIYSSEQATFGVSQGDPLGAGGAILGLAYQPGRFVNPGQSQGLGFPTGALGFAALACGLVVAAGGGFGRRDGMLLAFVGVALVAWFALSQQSRYLAALIPPLALLGGFAVARSKLRPLVVAAIAMQALFSLWMVWQLQGRWQMGLLTGNIDRDAFLSRAVSIHAAVPTLNALPPDSKVALYDEVFGFPLDVAYIWANPGHPHRLDYSELQSGEELIEALRDIGVTHVYVNLAYMDAETAEFMAQWLFNPLPQPLELDLSDRESSWRGMLAQASQSGLLEPVETFPNAILLEISN